MFFSLAGSNIVCEQDELQQPRLLSFVSITDSRRPTLLLSSLLHTFIPSRFFPTRISSSPSCVHSESLMPLDRFCFTAKQPLSVLTELSTRSWEGSIAVLPLTNLLQMCRCINVLSLSPEGQLDHLQLHRGTNRTVDRRSICSAVHT
ncbi:unnamed protein product [Pleuronectes platessa]|uniref:Uncharacterized protein n=1 Tax=Pleuronectes platessa TaxID=8262 RepID=A0A9N7V889_PLEPL|nr:unnamed protein product [Pleuronectes platessa]